MPKELRVATLIDGANELQILIRVYMPLNWGITSALNLTIWSIVAIVLNMLWTENGTWLDSVYCLVACVISGVTIFLMSSFALKMPELYWFFGRKA